MVDLQKLFPEGPHLIASKDLDATPEEVRVVDISSDTDNTSWHGAYFLSWARVYEVLSEYDLVPKDDT